MGYFRETVKGVSWTTALRVSTRIIALLRTVLLARLLTPLQFGLFGIASLVVAFLDIVTETGINVFFIQRKGEVDSYVDTAWIISIGRGILMALLIALLAPFIGRFFNAPHAVYLIFLASMVPLIKGFTNPAIIRFQKELQFQKEFWFRLFIFTVESTTAIVLAFLTKDAASLVVGLIVGGTVEVFLSFLVVKPWPRVRFRSAQAKSILGRGKWVTASGIFEYFFRHLDDIVIGRMLSPSFLGLYQMGYKVAELPITEVAVVMGKVTFPVYAKIADDVKRLRRAFIKTFLVSFALVIPIGVVFLFFAREVVVLLLGASWIAAAPALQVLSVFGVLRALSGTISILFLSMGKQELVTLVTFTNMLGIAIFVVPLVSTFGIAGAGAAASIGALFGLIVSSYYAWKLLR